MHSSKMDARDDEVRRASRPYHRGVVNLQHREDEERTRAAMGLIPRLGIAHASQSVGEFRRTDADRHQGKIVTPYFFPERTPGKPLPGASVEAILAWNALMAAIPDKLRFAYMDVPRYWLKSHGTILDLIC